MKHNYNITEQTITSFEEELVTKGLVTAWQIERPFETAVPFLQALQIQVSNLCVLMHVWSTCQWIC